MATYKYVDENGRTQTVAGVLDAVALTGVATTSGSNILTCASTTGVYPGMPISAPNIPLGAFVQAVKSATELELWLSIFNLSTGVTSTTAANANATATASSMQARALGYHPACIIASAFFLGAWRNLNGGLYSGNNAAGYPNGTYGSGMAVLPTAGTVSTGIAVPNAYEYIKSSDYLTTTPLKRHNGELWGVRPIVHTLGHLSHIPASPKSGLIYTGV